MEHPILTKKEADHILSAGEGKIEISLDLGINTAEISIKEGFAHIKGQKIALQEFSRLKEKSCYILDGNALHKLALFSDETNFYYKLMPTADWPTLTLSSTPMHRYTFISPKEDTLSKINEISPIKGKVLDTCCGLGYTAILSSKEADEVYTFEKDENVVEIAKLNPYSASLFNNKKIKLIIGDISLSIKRFENCFFDRIIHDPPTFRYAPVLYSKEFYLELFRVLKYDGILYHYSPCPHKTKGNIFYNKIIRRLNECGFKKAAYSPKSSGVRAVKL